MDKGLMGLSPCLDFVCDTVRLTCPFISRLSLLTHTDRQVVYVVKLDKTPPVYAILPSATLVSSTAVPLPNLFALLNIVLHNNLAFQDHLPSWIPHSCLSLAKRCFPIPLLHPLTIGLTLLAPILALLRGGSWPDVVWWCITPGMSWIVWYIHRWYVQMNEELLALERLRYDAKGA